MARGGHGRSRGFSNRHSHSRNRRHHGGGSAINVGNHFDYIVDTNIPPTLFNGVYTLQGGQINVMARINQPANTIVVSTNPMAEMSENPMMNMQPPTEMM